MELYLSCPLTEVIDAVKATPGHWKTATKSSGPPAQCGLSRLLTTGLVLFGAQPATVANCACPLSSPVRPNPLSGQ